MTDAREAELLAIIASLTKTIERLTVPRIYGGGGGAGAGFYPGDAYGGRGGPNISGSGGAGGGARGVIRFTVPPFPPHDGSGPDVNPATGDERETDPNPDDGEAT